MFIQTETQADINVIRFLPGRDVLPSGEIAFDDAADAARSPLAERIFTMSGVTRVVLDRDAVTVEKAGEADWAALKAPILGIIMEHYVSQSPILLSAAETAALGEEPDMIGEDGPVARELKELIDTRIRPAVAPSGGDVHFRGFEDGFVYLEMEGAAFAFRPRIEAMLKHYVPEVAAVRDFVDLKNKPGLATPEGIEVRRVLDEEINPSVADHGGHIALVDVQDTRVFIRLEGGCQGCGMADVTLKQGIEVGIRRAVPAITEVLDVTDHAGGTNPYYQPGKGGGASAY